MTVRRLLRRHPALFAGVLTLVGAVSLSVLPRIGGPGGPGGPEGSGGSAMVTAAGPSVGVYEPPAARAERVAVASRDSARAAVHADVPTAVSAYAGRLPAGTRQLLVVRAASTATTHARVLRFVRTADGWVRKNNWRARIGAGGLVKGTKRVQGTATTPTGSYSITEAFGRKSDPGTALPYRRVTADDWWVQDRNSRYYNQRRLGSQGGFLRSTSGYNSSEHLRSMGRQYDYVAVIDFNRPRPVVGRGSGIFLHVNGRGATAGCVSIGHRTMRTVLRWLQPAKQPMIVIGTRAGLRG